MVRNKPNFKRHHTRARQVSRVAPNIVTIMALCVGLTSLKFTFEGLWEFSLAAILIAAVLDGMDGRLARFLHSASNFGAELDSLSDFVCFGVAPAFLIYVFAFQGIPGPGWSLSLLFSACMALRLARFNVHRLVARKISWGQNFSIGLPAPAGAFTALLPLMSHLSFGHHIPPLSLALSMTISALLVISRVPVFVPKSLPFSPKRTAWALAGVTLLSGCLLQAPWGTLCLLGGLYICSIPISLVQVRRLRKNTPAFQPLKTLKKWVKAPL